MTKKVVIRTDKRFCECGCGELIFTVDVQGRPVRFVKGHDKRCRKDIPIRRCFKCGSDKTALSREGWHRWYYDRKIGVMTYPVICQSCYEIYVRSKTEKRRNNGRRYAYKDR